MRRFWWMLRGRWQGSEMERKRCGLVNVHAVKQVSDSLLEIRHVESKEVVDDLHHYVVLIRVGVWLLIQIGLIKALHGYLIQ